MEPLRSRVARTLAVLALWATPTFAADEIHWTIMGPTAVTFDWRGSETTIRYGATAAYGQTATAAPALPTPFSSAGPFQEARLTGLLPNALYHYSIGSGPDHTFRTPPVRGTSGFTIFAQGDIGDASSYSELAPIQAMIAAGAPAFTLMLGDLTYGGTNSLTKVDAHFNDMMVWSRDAAYMPVWGNHEYEEGDDLRNYKGRFMLPNPQTSPGSPTAGSGVPVPGRSVVRNGFRNPMPHTRERAENGSAASYYGFDASPAPVAGSIRMSLPLCEVTSCDRYDPTSCVGVMIGRPCAGLKRLFGAIISAEASTCASYESGRCTAIWSPSKSAL